MKRTGEKITTFSLMLCDIRSAQNAGAIMRTADALGVSEIIFGGYTPSPLDRFGREHKAFTKSSLGSERSVPYRTVKDYVREVSALKKKGVFIIALEQNQRSLDYKKIQTSGRNVLVLLGNEVDGLSKKLLAKADVIAEIPMRGKKESLNVSVSAGIALFRWFDLST